MRWIMVVPGALVPSEVAPELLNAAALPKMAQRLLRATPLDHRNRHDHDKHTLAPNTPGAPHLDWLAQAFGVPPASESNAQAQGCWPTAPYAWRSLPIGPGDLPGTDDDVLWHADPVHFAFARDHLLVAPLVETMTDHSLAPGTVSGLTDAERGALLEAALEYTAPLGISIEQRGGLWFMRLPADWQLVTTPLAAAMHQPLHEVWPDGPDARRWRQLMNDIQIAWHQLPLNDARIDAGAREVNGIWLHGGGRWKPLCPATTLAYRGNDPTLQGWAAAGGAPTTPHAATVTARAKGKATDQVEIWHGLSQAAHTEAWGDWLLAWAAFGEQLDHVLAQATEAGASELQLVLGGRAEVRNLVIRSTDRFRLWRRTDASLLASLLSESHS